MVQFPTRTIWTAFRHFVRDQRAATAIEYAMIASGVSIVIAGTIIGLGNNIKGLYNKVAAALN